MISFLSKVKYTISKAFVIVSYQISYNMKILTLISYVIRDLVGNKNKSIANCIFYLTEKSNQPEDGSQLELKHVAERNSVRNTP